MIREYFLCNFYNHKVCRHFLTKRIIYIYFLHLLKFPLFFYKWFSLSFSYYPIVVIILTCLSVNMRFKHVYNIWNFCNSVELWMRLRGSMRKGRERVVRSCDTPTPSSPALSLGWQSSWGPHMAHWWSSTSGGRTSMPSHSAANTTSLSMHTSSSVTWVSWGRCGY